MLRSPVYSCSLYVPLVSVVGWVSFLSSPFSRPRLLYASRSGLPLDDHIWISPMQNTSIKANKYHYIYLILYNSPAWFRIGMSLIIIGNNGELWRWGGCLSSFAAALEKENREKRRHLCFAVTSSSVFVFLACLTACDRIGQALW